MKLRKDVQIAWNLLHLLTPEYQKTLEVLTTMRAKYGLTVGGSSIQKIVHALATAGLIDALGASGRGIRSNGKRVFLVDVFKALGIKTNYQTNHPAGRTYGRILDSIQLIFVETVKGEDIAKN